MIKFGKGENKIYDAWASIAKNSSSILINKNIMKGDSKFVSTFNKTQDFKTIEQIDETNEDYVKW